MVYRNPNPFSFLSGADLGTQEPASSTNPFDFLDATTEQDRLQRRMAALSQEGLDPALLGPATRRHLTAEPEKQRKLGLHSVADAGRAVAGDFAGMGSLLARGIDKYNQVVAGRESELPEGRVPLLDDLAEGGEEARQRLVHEGRNVFGGKGLAADAVGLAAGLGPDIAPVPPVAKLGRKLLSVPEALQGLSRGRTAAAKVDLAQSLAHERPTRRLAQLEPDAVNDEAMQLADQVAEAQRFYGASADVAVQADEAAMAVTPPEQLDIPTPVEPTTLKKVGRTLNKWLSTGGNLPREMHERILQRGFHEQAEIARAEAIALDMRQAIKGYAKEHGNDLEEVNSWVSRAMHTYDEAVRAGDPDMVSEAWRDLPPELRGHALKARRHLDTLSSAFLDEELVAEEVAKTFRQRMGQYMHRSYRAFDDKKWWDKIKDDEEIIGPARQLLMDEGSTPAEAMEAIRGLAMRDKGSSRDFVRQVASNSLPAILRSRSAVPIQFRRVMGEIVDPDQNYFRSISRMSAELERRRLRRDLLQDLEARNMIAPELDAAGHRKVPMNQQGEVMGDVVKTLDDDQNFLATKAVADELNYRLDEDIGNNLSAIVRASGYIKGQATVFNFPAGPARNFTSNFLLQTAAGRSPIALPKVMAQAGRLTKHGASSLPGRKLADEALTEEYSKLVGLGVLRDSVAVKEWKLYANGGFDNAMRLPATEKAAGKAKAALRKISNVAQDLYLAGDDYHKASAFYQELARYKKAMPELSTAELEKRAAQIVRDTMPTYSMSPRAVDKLRRTPVIASFPSFPAEVLRTTKNNLALGLREVMDPRTRKIGAQRLAGLATAMAAPTATSAALGKYLHGRSAEEWSQDEERARTFLAPWSQANAGVPILSKGPGSFVYMDLSYMDPHHVLKAPVAQLVRDGLAGKISLDDIPQTVNSLLDAAWAQAEPFLGAEMLAQAASEAYLNQKKDGGKVSKDTSAAGSVIDRTRHVMRAFYPGTARGLGRFLRAYNEPYSEFGRVFEPVYEALSFVTGVKAVPVDVSRKSAFLASEYLGQRNSLQAQYQREAINLIRRNPAKLQRVKQEYQAKIDNLEEDLIRTLADARHFGATPKDLLLELSGSPDRRGFGIPKSHVERALRGQKGFWSLRDDNLQELFRRQMRSQARGR